MKKRGHAGKEREREREREREISQLAQTRINFILFYECKQLNPMMNQFVILICLRFGTSISRFGFDLPDLGQFRTNTFSQP